MADSSPGSLDAFERALLEAIAGISTHAATLRAQVAGAAVVGRETDATGRTTYLCVAATAPRLSDGELTLRATVGLVGAPDAAAELTLHNGWLDSLYAGATGGEFPAEPRLVGVTPAERPGA